MTHSDKEGRKERRENSQLCVEDEPLKEEGYWRRGCPECVLAFVTGAASFRYAQRASPPMNPAYTSHMRREKKVEFGGVGGGAKRGRQRDLPISTSTYLVRSYLR